MKYYEVLNLLGFRIIKFNAYNKLIIDLRIYELEIELKSSS